MEQLDQQALALTKAIRQHESGGDFTIKGKSGESGAYQFTAPTWKSYAKEILGDENAEMTPQNQNKVAYTKVKQWKDSGKNVGQIASMWNAGEGRPNAYKENYSGTNKYGVHYDTPAYAKAVAEYYQQFKQGGGTNSTQRPQGQSSAGGYVTSANLPEEVNKTYDKRQEMKDKGQAVSINPAKTDPTLGGSIVREAIKLPLQLGLSVARPFVNNKEGLTVRSGYLGNTSDLLKETTDTSKRLARRVKDKEITLGGAAARTLGNTALKTAEIGAAGEAVGAVKNLIKGVLTNVAKRGSALQNPEIINIIKSSGKGSRQGAIDRLTAYLKNMPVSQVGSQKEQLILKAIKELNPTSVEKQALLSKMAKGGWNLVKAGVLAKVLGDTVGGFVNRNTDIK